MAFPIISSSQVNQFLEPPLPDIKQLALMSCVDGSDGYPTLMDFNAHMEKYLSGKKRADRTVISTADLQQIHQLLSDPVALRADPNPSYRTWVKKTFFLNPTPLGTVVCHREKGQSIGRPIAAKESMYFILKEAHASEGHGGRDKTAKAVKNTHSYIRKGLICIFLETCPTCQTRNEAAKERKLSQENNQSASSHESIASYDAAFPSPISSAGFAIERTYERGNDMFQSTPSTAGFSFPSRFVMRRPTMPPELALVPAAPIVSNRSRYGSYPLYSTSRKSQRGVDSNVADYPLISARNLHSPYVNMSPAPFPLESSQTTLQTPLEYSALNSAPATTDSFSPHDHPFQWPGQNSDSWSWAHEPHAPTPLPDNPESSFDIDFSRNRSWSEGENMNATGPVHLPAPQPQVASSNGFVYSFMEQPLSPENNAFAMWPSISPMSNTFPSSFNQSFT